MRRLLNFLSWVAPSLIAGCRPAAAPEPRAPAPPPLVAAALAEPLRPHAPVLSGQVIVLPAAGETLDEPTRAAEAATVEALLAAFQWDGTRFRGPDFHVRSLVVLDPALVGEESGAPTPGLCYDDSRTVVLNRDLWRAYGDDEREVVLYHELGHCDLDRRHTHGQRADGSPASVMNPNSVAAAGAIAAARESYLRELFTTRQPPPHTITAARRTGSR